MCPRVRLHRLAQLTNLQGKPTETLNKRVGLHSPSSSIHTLLLQAFSFHLSPTPCGCKSLFKVFPAILSCSYSNAPLNRMLRTHVASSKGSVEEESKQTGNVSFQLLPLLPQLTLLLIMISPGSCNTTHSASGPAQTVLGLRPFSHCYSHFPWRQALRTQPPLTQGRPGTLHRNKQGRVNTNITDTTQCSGGTQCNLVGPRCSFLS